MIDANSIQEGRIGRFLIDYDNPDAGIGHSLGHVNNAVKVCLRHDLKFAYSDRQLVKSNKDDFKWRVRQFLRVIVGRKAHETHGIGDAICRMFAFAQFTVDLDHVEALIQKRRLRVVHIPPADIVIPSNDQDDELVYEKVDAAVRAHPQDGIAFVLPPKRTGDFEYLATRDWFKGCYLAAQHGTSSPSRIGGDTTPLQVALHVRRGDLLPGRQFADLAHRMLPDLWYVSVLAALYKVAKRRLHVVVISEGVDGTYRSELGAPFSWTTALADLDCEVEEKIDFDFAESFHLMVQADVLIGSKSGMTHLAGLMNDNIKLVPRMWHSYRGTRHVLELADTVDTTTLEAALKTTWSGWLTSKSW